VSRSIPEPRAWPDRAGEVEGRRLWAALMLARDPEVARSILLKRPVLVRQLDLAVLRRALRGGPLPDPGSYLRVRHGHLDAIAEGGEEPAQAAPENDTAAQSGRPWSAETWPEFRDHAPEEHEWIVDDVLPKGALAFIAAPPKAGKTWIGVGLSLAIVTGHELFGEYAIPRPRNVLYIALEGSRTGLRTRFGALARGLELDPDSDDLDRLHLLYRPRPFDLAEAAAADWLSEEAARVDAALVVVDVLRAAARFKENTAEEFSRVREGLDPLLIAGRSVALLHHFGKLTEQLKERSPGERMAGTGAMYGALDVGFLITRSESGARRLRLEVEARDFAPPAPLGIVIVGTGSGKHGGFTYADTASFAIDATAAGERDLADEAERLFEDGVWRTLTDLSSKTGIAANKDDVRAALEGAPERFVLVTGSRVGRHPTAQPWGTAWMLADLEKDEEVAQPSEPPEPAHASSGDQLRVEQVAPPIGELAEPPAHPNSVRVAPSDEPPTDVDEVGTKESDRG
jgi:AAA domain